MFGAGRCCSLAALFFAVTLGRPSDDGAFHLTVVHVNDVHARFQETNRDGGKCPEGVPCYGGMARVAEAASRILRDEPNSIFLNAGDNYQGSIYYTLFHWNVTQQILNLLPFDAMTLGNHEFDSKISGIVPLLERINFPVVVANIDASLEPTFEQHINKSVVINRGGRRIGIIGYIIKDTARMSSAGKLIFLDEVESVAKEAERLKKDGVDIIIGLSHAGIVTDRLVAASVKDIDVIVGGHSHTLLYSGVPPDGDIADGDYPVIVEQSSGRKVPIVQAKCFTKYLGKLTVEFDGNGEVLTAYGNPILLDSSVSKDPAVVKALQPWEESVRNTAKVPIATTKVLLDNTLCRALECNLDNLLADAMVNEQVQYSAPGYWTKASIALLHSGNSRTSIPESTDDKPITFEDLVVMSPFENTVDTAEILGSDLLEVMETSVAMKIWYTSPDKKIQGYYIPGLIQHSGMQVTYNLGKPVGHRVQHLKILCNMCRVPKYESLQLDKWYTVTMLSFFVENRLKDKIRNRTIGRLDVEVFKDYMAKMSPITQGIDGRLQVIYEEGKFPVIIS